MLIKNSPYVKFMASPYIQELWKIVNNEDDDTSKRFWHHLAEMGKSGK